MLEKKIIFAIYLPEESFLVKYNDFKKEGGYSFPAVNRKDVSRKIALEEICKEYELEISESDLRLLLIYPHPKRDNKVVYLFFCKLNTEKEKNFESAKLKKVSFKEIKNNLKEEDGQKIISAIEKELKK